MEVIDKTQLIHNTNQMQSMLEELQRNTLSFVLIGLFIACLILGGEIAQGHEYFWALSTALGLLFAIPIIWALQRISFTLACLSLVLVVLLAVLSVVFWAKNPFGLALFIFPVGLACLLLGGLAGTLAALGCTLLIVWTPAFIPSVDPGLRLIAVMTIWGAHGMIWLTLAPLLTAVDWSWKAYQQSHMLLAQAQDYQVRLYGALEELKNANNQLNRLNTLANGLRQIAEDERRIKQQFVANVSHELRTPLNMIIGFCEMILKSPQVYGKIPSTLLADLQVVLRNSQHLSALIDDVLDLSQIEAGQMALVREWVNIPEIIEAVTIAVRPLFESKRLYLKVDLQANLPAVYCDRTRIREVILNLLSNAGRFTEQGGVSLRVWRENRFLLLSIADTGPGITEEDQQRLFQPFQQLDSTIRRRYGGTGLGLCISKSFIELHGGKMWVESQIGAGTTFYFQLPIEPVELVDPGVSRWINPSQTYATIEKPLKLPSLPLVDGRGSILVIEKGTVLQRLLRRYLAHTEICVAPDLQAARQVLEQSPARLVLMNEPGLQTSDAWSGGVAGILPEAAPLPEHTPLILCSIAEPLLYAPTPDVIEILVKPITREHLLSAVEKLDRPAERILVVDDEPDAQKLFLRMLYSTERGYQVRRASNGVQAFRLLKEHTFDLVLLDLFMPEMDGFELLRRKAQEPNLCKIPVILISARDPHGQPIVSSHLTVVRRSGLTIQQLLDSIHALSAILTPNSPV